MRERSEGMRKIAGLRAQIDAIDDKLVRVLFRRASLAIKVGLLKERHGLAALSSDRERQILQRLSRADEGPLDAAAIKRIFRVIVQESRRAAIRVRYKHG